MGQRRGSVKLPWKGSGHMDLVKGVCTMFLLAVVLKRHCRERKTELGR